MKRIEIVIKRLLKYLALGVICFFFENILESIGGMNVFIKDIHFITMNGSLICLGILVGVIAVYVFMQNNISSLHIWLKKHRQYLIIASVVFEILFFYKCKNAYQSMVCIVEFLLLYFLIDCETSKIYKYNFEETSQIGSNYVEKPVIGRSNLTFSQCNALEQLKTIIDNRSSSDSFNIALIGAWGSGKTSITDTLIYEYERDNNKYFILKIGTLTLKETKNVVTYVKNYFEDLFRKYEIGIAGRNVAFLTSLAKSFNGAFSIGDMLNGADDNCFFDIEKEKELFTKQVSKLLKISGRKNILFLIDDTDRSDDEEQIIKLLTEFASIDGIISIISLDKSKDVIIRPHLSDDINESVYNQIDKYIHVRIRISEDNHIEYDKSISNQIITAFDNIIPKVNCFISCDGRNIKNSLFASVKDYQTTEILSSRNFSANTYNILTEIFLENLKSNSKQFGTYFEELMNEYIYNSKELIPYIQQMLIIPKDKWKIELYMVNAQWTNLFEMNGFDWLMRLQGNSGTLFWTLCGAVEALDLVSAFEDVKKEVANIEDAYDYWMINKFPVDGRTWGNRKEQPVVYSGFDQIRLIVFGEAEYEYLNQEIEKGDYDAAKDIVIDKLKGVANLFLTTMILADFMEYLRTILNNYRSFKMQLREAELLNVNYLDYLIKEWQPRKEVRENLKKMKENSPILETINLGFPSLTSFINNVLFENYVLKFGNRFRNEELKDGRLFLYHGNSEPIIVISKKQTPVNKCIFLDASGNIVTDISEETMVEIEEMNHFIWSD